MPGKNNKNILYTYLLLKPYFFIVWLNEPLSMLQRLCETFRFADLLNLAAKEKNPHIRLAYVAAFCVCGYKLHSSRLTKFFNPVLGETFEYVDNKLNFRYFAEQVSHHPAISAMHCEGDGWVIYANTNAKAVFNLFGNALEIDPIGRTFVKFFDHDDELISITKPKSIVHNIMFGDMYLEPSGKSLCTNHNTGDVVEMTFYEKGSPTHPDFGYIDGFLKDINGNTDSLKITSNWNTSFFDIKYKDETKKDQVQTLWKTEPINDTKEELEQKFYFSFIFVFNIEKAGIPIRGYF